MVRPGTVRDARSFCARMESTATATLSPRLTMDLWNYDLWNYQCRMLRAAALSPEAPLPEQATAGLGRPDDGSTIHLLDSDQPAVVGVFPDGQPRAGSAPGVHYFWISTLPRGQVPEEVEDEDFYYGIVHRLSCIQKIPRAAGRGPCLRAQA